jgi:hypothetical protein
MLEPGLVNTAYTDRLETYDFERVSAMPLGPVIARGDYSDIPFARKILSYLPGMIPAAAGRTRAGSPFSKRDYRRPLHGPSSMRRIARLRPGDDLRASCA